MCSLEKRGNLFLLTLTGDGVDEHRLNSTLISSIRSALSDASLHSTHGSVLLTIAQGKFFCNGFDFNTTDTIFQLNQVYKCLVADFISIPSLCRQSRSLQVMLWVQDWRLRYAMTMST
ncbi:putative ClpP/crotonase-like domain superfamily [Helianthus annuus]|nr:putative ClpP/crotonase-like domain superfamily [Helianthus annuus]KAJ0928029.1 putative ClpP/crotonase-like domain superfamily [Helianthus annuus]